MHIKQINLNATTVVDRYMHKCIVTMHSAWNLIDDNLVETSM